MLRSPEKDGPAESHVSRQLSEVESIIEGMKATKTMLEERLLAILRPNSKISPPTREEYGNVEEYKVELVPLANRIRYSVIALQEINDDFRDFLTRLEL